MEDKKEMIEHTVVVDEYISATIKIPKILDAMDLKALMVKSNKLFNLAEVKINDVDTPSAPSAPSAPRGPGRPPTYNTKNHKKLSLEEIEQVINDWAKGDLIDRNELADSLKLDRNDLARKVSYWKKRHNIEAGSSEDNSEDNSDDNSDVENTSRTGNGPVVWTPGMNAMFVNMVKKGKTVSEIASHFGLIPHKIHQKKARLKNAGKL